MGRKAIKSVLILIAILFILNTYSISPQDHKDIIMEANLLLDMIGYAEKGPELPPNYKKWLEQEVVYIITSKEEKVFKELETDKQRDLFIEEFWKQRDPTPGTPQNEFREEHYRRIEYSNKWFSRGA